MFETVERYKYPEYPSKGTEAVFLASAAIRIYPRLLTLIGDRLDVPSMVQTAYEAADEAGFIFSSIGVVYGTLAVLAERRQVKQLEARLKYPKLCPGLDFEQAVTNLNAQYVRENPDKIQLDGTLSSIDGEAFRFVNGMLDTIERYDDSSPYPYRQFTDYMDQRYTNVGDESFDATSVHKVFSLMDQHLPIDPQWGAGTWQVYYEQDLHKRLAQQPVT